MNVCGEYVGQKNTQNILDRRVSLCSVSIPFPFVLFAYSLLLRIEGLAWHDCLRVVGPAAAEISGQHNRKCRGEEWRHGRRQFIY